MYFSLLLLLQAKRIFYGDYLHMQLLIVLVTWECTVCTYLPPKKQTVALIAFYRLKKLVFNLMSTSFV